MVTLARQWYGTPKRRTGDLYVPPHIPEYLGVKTGYLEDNDHLPSTRLPAATVGIKIGAQCIILRSRDFKSGSHVPDPEHILLLATMSSPIPNTPAAGKVPPVPEVTLLRPLYVL
jgi:hypothetical protein